MPALAFADPKARADWVATKGMRVFSVWDPADPMRQIDLFIEHPIPFEDVWNRSVEVTLDSTTVHIASIDDLIVLKASRTDRRTSGISRRWSRSVSEEKAKDAEPEPLGGWGETRAWRLDLTLAATPAQRLRWLEAAIELAHRAGALPKRR